MGGRLIPESAPVSSSDLDRLLNLMTASKRTAVITGAGVSTASGIPDYRGPGGAYTTGYTPMTHQKFMGTDRARSRYWARSYAGWETFRDHQPNDCHNVDRLHHRAGSEHVVELHGTIHHVKCTDCGEVTDREEFQDILRRLNPEFATGSKRKPTTPENDPGLIQGKSRSASLVRPDGDVDLCGREKGFLVPSCPRCSGILKPDVVFFGDAVPRSRAETAHDICSESEVLLVVGSSVMVYSAYRLVKAAKDHGATVAVVNVGDTRADDMCDIKVESVAGEVFSRLARHPTLSVPRIRNPKVSEERLRN